MIGCLRRTARLFDIRTGLSMLLPLDHGVTEGMLPGLEDISEKIKLLSEIKASGLIVHKGVVLRQAENIPLDKNIVIHLSAGTKHGIPQYCKTLVSSVGEAQRLGADAVSMHVNIGNDLEDRMLADLGMVVDEAHLAGLPVLAMIYARGGQIINELNPALVSHCIRLGAEFGADLIKVPYSGDYKSFSRAVSTCPVPVLVAGGPKQPDFGSFLDMIKSALDAGSRGVSVGRNLFQQDDPLQAIKTLQDIMGL